jgi:hypothetical protein
MTDQDPTQDKADDGLAPDHGLASGTQQAGEAGAGEHSAVTADEAPTQPVAPEVVASLTDALRAMYDNVVDEPLPDAFANLLSRLDDSDG